MCFSWKRFVLRFKNTKFGRKLSGTSQESRGEMVTVMYPEAARTASEVAWPQACNELSDHVPAYIALPVLCSSRHKDVEKYEKISYLKRYGDLGAGGTVPSYFPKRYYEAQNSYDELNRIFRPGLGARSVTCPV